MADDGGIDLGIAGVEHAVEVGRGGFGVVYRASQPALGRTVAVKVLPVRPDAQARELFERECRELGALSGHPNTMTVFDSGFTDDGEPYIVMEYMVDGSLGDRIRRSGALPWEQAVAIGVKVASAVDLAHRSGVLHRDVKPENVLLSPYDEPIVADFGLARLQGGTASGTGSVTTSFAHTAPEVIDGQEPSVAGDVYSLASTVFALIAGRAAFVGDSNESLVAVVARIVSAPVPDLRPLGVPDAVCRVLEQSMAKDPARRPASAGAFGAELEQAARQPLDASPQVTQPVPPAVVAPTSATAPVPTSTQPPAYPQPVPVAAVLEPSPGSDPANVTATNKGGRTAAFVIGAWVVVAAIAGAGVVLLLSRGGGSSSRDVTLVVADTTNENKVASDAHVVVGTSSAWFLEMHDKRATRVYKDALKPGTRLSVTVTASAEVHLQVDLPEKFADGDLTAVVTIGDNSTSLEFGEKKATAKRANPAAEARAATRAAFVKELKRVVAATKSVEDLAKQATDANKAIYGADQKAPRGEIAQGITANVLPKLQQAIEKLKAVTSTDSRILSWLTLRARCLSVAVQSLGYQRSAAFNGTPSPDVVSASGNDASKLCDDARAKLKSLKADAGIS